MTHFWQKECFSCNKSLIRIADDWYEFKLHASCGVSNEIDILDRERDSIEVKGFKIGSNENMDISDDDFDSDDFSIDFSQTEREAQYLGVGLEKNTTDGLDSCRRSARNESEIVKRELNKSIEHSDLSRELFSCGYCDSGFNEKFEMENHMKVVHRSAGDINEYSKVNERRDALKTMTNSNESIRNWFVCGYCDVEFEEKEEVERHMKITHQDSNIGTKKLRNVYSITCKICNNVLSGQKAFDSHMLRHTSQIPRNPNPKPKRELECSFCHKKCESPYALRIHTEQTHENDLEHICESCGKRFTSKASLKQHRFIHAEENQFKCTLCPKTFRYKRFLNRHMVDHAGLRKTDKRPCSQCDKSFANQYTLECHVKFVHEGVSFPCKTCGKVYSRKGALMMHERIHSETCPFMCSVCGKGFYQRSSLEAHNISHSADRTYSCEICDKKFKTVYQLNNHNRTHTGEKLYKCRVENCTRDYAHTTDFKRHQFNAHGICEKEHICQICSKVFAENKSLKKHMESHNIV